MGVGNSRSRRLIALSINERSSAAANHTRLDGREDVSSYLNEAAAAEPEGKMRDVGRMAGGTVVEGETESTLSRSRR